MRTNQLYAILTLTSLMLVGCGPQDQPYDTVAKAPDMISSSDIEQYVIGTDGVKHARRYLYLRTIRKAPRYFASLGSNTWYNDTKLVTLHRSENGIDVLEEDKGAIGAGQNYSPFDNPENLRPLLTIDGDYVDYRCSTDDYGECTNEEEENTDADLTWDKKKYFVPDLSDITIKDIGGNDVDINHCLVKTGSPRVVRRTEESENGKDVTWNGHEIDLKRGIINLEIAQDYTASLSAGCESFSPQTTLNDYSLTVTSFISIVALDSEVPEQGNKETLVSSDYLPIPYAEREKNTFGFFSTTINHRNAYNQVGRNGEFRRYLNRWNPKKDKLHYYLSNNFYEAKNKPYLAAAKQGIALLNAENKVFHTGVPEIKLAPAGNRQSGDLRYAIIELADEPLANGLLGYAPTAENPLTGEIVSAVVNQYSGNAINMVPYYWNRIRRSFNHHKFSQNQINQQVVKPAPYILSKATQEDIQYTLNEPLVNDGSGFSDKTRIHFAKVLSGKSEQLTDIALSDLRSHKIDNIIYQHQEDGESVSLTNLAKQEQEKLYNLGRHNMLSTKALIATDYGNGDYRTLPQGVRALPGEPANKYRIDWSNSAYYIDQQHLKLKKFNQLSVADQQDLKVKLSAAIFASTLTHEMGHSLGLRHNFMGSVDAKNYNFTHSQMLALKQELKNQGYPDIEPHSNSSSRMEYSLDSYSTGYGPYDMAALRFGYAREVELSSGLIASSGSLPSDIKLTSSDSFVSLKSRDEARRQEIENIEGRGEATGQYSRGVIDVQLSSEIKPYQFCTDENTFLGNTCNRFDAGFNSTQIISNIIRQYHDSYEVQNTRDGHENYGINYLTGYTINQMNLFESLHAFIEDSHDLMTSGEDGLDFNAQKNIEKIISECQGQDPVTGVYPVSAHPYVDRIFNGNHTISDTVCDMIEATDHVRNFLLDLAIEPMGRFIHATYTLVSDPTNTKKQLNVPYKLATQAYLEQGGDLALAPGELIVDADRYQTLLRNIAVVAGNVVEGTPIQLTSDKVTLVGHPLNSGSAVVRDSNHSYVNDRDYLGIWPDKLLAVRTLLSRVSTHVIPTSTTAALADARFVGERLKLAVCRQAIGNAALTGFECFSVLDPALITDPTAVKAFDALQLKDNSLYNTLADWATTKIETVPTFSYPVAAFFAVPVHGQISYLNAMLNQFVLGSQSNNRGALNSAAKSYRDFAGVYSATSYLPTKGVIDMSDAAASARILEVLLKTTPPKSSNVRFTVYLPDAQDSFIVSGNNRLALVLLKAYTSLSQHSSAKTSEFQKSMKRLSTILQTMPRIDENSQLVTAQ